MQQDTDETKWKELARQLRQPEGVAGKKTAEIMRTSNETMIRNSIDLMMIPEQNLVLEIGPGSGRHIDYLFEKVNPFLYVGVDISETMLEEAKQYFTGKSFEDSLSFVLTDGQSLPFEDNSFDRIFSVNTVYFWRDPKAYALEIFRVLKPGGLICLTYGEKNFMESLPFIQYGFKLYDAKMTASLLSETGFQNIRHSQQSEAEDIVFGAKTPRRYLITLAEK